MESVTLWQPARWRGSAVATTAGAIALVWVAFVALYHYPHRRDAEFRRVETDMLLRTNVRTTAVELWFDDLHGAAGTIDAFPTVRQILTQPGPQEIARLSGVLDGFNATEGLLASLVLDTRGRPVVAAGDTAHLAPVLAAAARTARPTIDILQAADGRPLVLGAVPTGMGGRRTGTTVVVADPERWLFPFLLIAGDIPSYEIVLVRMDGDTITNASPLSAGPAAFAVRFPQRPDLPTAAARFGVATVGRSTDYRGIRVIATGRRVTGTRLTLVAKVDETAALAAFRRRAFVDYLQWSLLLALVLGVLARVAHRQRRAWEHALAGSTAQRHQVEELLGGLATASPAAIVAVDRDGLVTFWNPAAERILGWSAAEALGRPIPFVPASRAQELTDILERTLLGESVTREVTRARKDGSRIELLSSTAPLRDPAGTVVGSVAVMSDITERRIAEEALRNAEEKLRSLAEHAPDIIYRYRLGPEAGFEFVSPSAETITGFAPADFSADPGLVRRLVHPDDLHLLDGVRNGTTDAPAVLRWIRKDGAVIWTEQRNTVIRDGRGHPVAIEGIARDVTVTRAAAAERALLSTALDQAAEGIVITDAEGTILHVNPAFELLTGYARAEVVGKNPRLLKSGRQTASHYEQMWSQLKRGQGWRGEFVNRRKDGALYTAAVVISPVVDGSGRIVNFVGFQRDVTREREIDDHLRHVQRIEAVGQLTGGIAHDFNNLLAVILMNAGTLRQDLHLEDPVVRHTLGDLEAAARRGAELVRKLMAFSRRDTIVREPRDLAPLLNDVERTLRRLLPETITIELVRPTATVPVHIDAGAFEQIALNLATNARDAMPDGGRLGIQLDVQHLDPRTAGERTLPEGAYAVVTVTDTGHGMEPATLERAVEPFFTTKAVGAGTGLGLSMVHGLMHQHDGFLTLTSRKGRGTTVRLCFPLHQAAEPLLPRPDAPAGAIPHGRGEPVLLVEDEPDVRRGATRLLERLGYKVATAANGKEALDVIAATPGIALVISDAVMPEMSGPELLRRLRASGNQVPFVLASGYAAGGQVAALALDPSVITVDKPFTVEILARAVRSALDGNGRP